MDFHMIYCIIAKNPSRNKDFTDDTTPQVSKKPVLLAVGVGSEWSWYDTRNMARILAMQIYLYWWEVHTVSTATLSGTLPVVYLIKSWELPLPAMVCSHSCVFHHHSRVLKCDGFWRIVMENAPENGLDRRFTFSTFTTSSWIALSRDVCPNFRTIGSRNQSKMPMTPKMWPTKPRIGRRYCHMQDPTHHKGWTPGLLSTEVCQYCLF